MILQKIERYWHGRLRRPYQLKCPVDIGKGEVVVMLHGIASSGQSWQPVIDNLDQRAYRIVALDLLGFGTSPQPKWLEYSIDDHVRSIMITLKRKGIRKPFILVGHSMGSLVAAEIAQQYPDKVKHLILHQMPAYNPEFAAEEQSVKHRAYRKAFSFIAAHPATTLFGARIISRAAAQLGGFSLTKDNWYSFEKSLKNTILEKSKRTKHVLTMPTDVIYGTYDLLILRKNAQQFFEPSLALRFYTVKETHRMAARSGKLIAELIEQNTAKNRKLSTKSATLLTRFRMTNTRSNQYPLAQFVRDHWRTLIGLCVFGGLFIWAAVVAARGVMTGWEIQVFQAINVWDAPQWYTLLARIVSDAVWVAVAGIAVLVLLPKARNNALKVAVPTVGIYAVGYLIEHIVNRGRPEVLLHGEAIIRAIQDGPGFPSGHMLASTGIVAALWRHISIKVRVLGVLLIVIEGWSRIFLGVHAPLDIVGGVSLVIAGWCVIDILPRKLQTILRLK